MRKNEITLYIDIDDEGCEQFVIDAPGIDKSIIHQMFRIGEDYVQNFIEAELNTRVLH